MQLSKIRIRNYRLLIDAELEVDPKTTLIVGRNNTAKTSCCKCQRKSEPDAHEKVSHKRPRKSEPERSRIVEPVC